MRYAISSCLMGINCKYSGGNNAHAMLLAYMKDKEYLLVCPEVLGGLPIPRASAEIVQDQVKNTKGEDVTQAFLAGAQLALQQVVAFHADMVITQSRSPSCGKASVYDGTFTKQLKAGNGIFVQLLEKEGIQVVDIQTFLDQLTTTR